MKSIIAFCAEGIIKDAISNNVTAYNIIEKISSPGFPLFVQKIFFFCLIEKKDDEPESVDVTLEVSNNGKKLIDLKLRPKFTVGNRNRQIVEIGGLAIPAPGEITFSLQYNKDIFCSYSIEIKQTQKPSIKEMFKEEVEGPDRES